MGRDDIGQRSETVRRANLSAIVRELHARGPLSRSELVARTGLTRSAIRGLIGELVLADLVTEERAAPRDARSAVAAGPPEPGGCRRPGARHRGRFAGRGRGRAGRRRPRHDPDRPRAAIVGRRDRADLAGSWPRPGPRPAGERVDRHRRRGRRGRPPRPTGSCRWRPTSAGRTSARRAADRGPRREVPISSPTRPISGPSPSAPRRSARRGRVLFISGEVGVGGGLIVDGQPFTGVAGYGKLLPFQKNKLLFSGTC